MPETRTKTSIYMQAVRTFSFPASMIPCLIGIMFSLLLGLNVVWWLLPFIMISLLLLHSASNVISDVDDYRTGVDAEGTLGGSGVLVSKLLQPKEMFRFGITLFALAILIGLPIIFTRGLGILLFGLLGIFGGFFYTGRPVGYKYLALGDFFIFLIYGPAIVSGTFYALTGLFDWHVTLASLPLGFLVAGIVQANNLRDIIHDRKANIRTLATIFGKTFAKAEYLFLIIGAYVTLIVLVALHILSAWSLIVFISLPPAIKNMNMIRGVEIDDTAKIAMLDAQTAQLTLMFGVLMSISILITKFL